jgi:hypothetical protein
MLKAVKHLSMNATILEVLQNANAIEILTKLLDEQSSGPYSTVMFCQVPLAALVDSSSCRKSPTIFSKRSIIFVA